MFEGLLGQTLDVVAHVYNKLKLIFVLLFDEM